MRRIETIEQLIRGHDGWSPLDTLFVTIFRELDARLDNVEGTSKSVSDLEKKLVAYGEQLVDQTVDPLLAKILAAADLGVVFTGHSQSTVEVGTGVRTFVVDEIDRATFAPPLYLAIATAGDPPAVMWARKLTWDKATGVLDVEVLSATGAGLLSGWTITAGVLVPIAGEIGSSPSGPITANTVQTAIDEIGAALMGIGGFRNALINPDFAVRRRGAGVAVAADGGWICDRWRVRAKGAGASRTIQAAGPVDGETWLEATVAGVNGDAWEYVEQKIEGAGTFAGKTVTLSLDVDGPNSVPAPRIGLRVLQDFGTGGAPSAPVVVFAQAIELPASGWNEITRSFTLPSIAAKTLGSDGNHSLILQVFFSLGSVNGALVPGVPVQSGAFRIRGLQLHKGTTRTEPERRPLTVEEMLCARYYQGVGKGVPMMASSASVIWAWVAFPVRMRRAPAVSLHSPASNSLWVMNASHAAISIATTPVFASTFPTGASVNLGGFSGSIVAGDTGFISDPAEGIFFDAEL